MEGERDREIRTMIGDGCNEWRIMIGSRANEYFLSWEKFQTRNQTRHKLLQTGLNVTPPNIPFSQAYTIRIRECTIEFARQVSHYRGNSTRMVNIRNGKRNKQENAEKAGRDSLMLMEL